MRYLWIEDFNDGRNVEEDLKETLMNFFGLNDDKLIIETDLSSAIGFLEKTDSFSNIDAILIDIRFPQGTVDDLYEKYFKEIVTAEFYKEHIENAAGIMLYILLIFKYHFPQNKIAFISANIRRTSPELEELYSMIKIILKSEFESLSEDDILSYRTSELKLGKKILHIGRDDKTWDNFITSDNNIEKIDKKKLIEVLENLPNKYIEEFKIKDASMMPYEILKNQFDKIGLMMPSAFEKPKRYIEVIKKCYSFFEWEEKLYSNQYISIRSNILEMLNIIEQQVEHAECDITDFAESFISLLGCNDDEICSYNDDFFISYVKDLKDLFVIEKDYYNSSLILKEISSVWEAATIPFYNKDYDIGRYSYDKNKKCYNKRQNGNYYCYNNSKLYAYHATLKIVRNWMGHQGIKDIGMLDIGFLMLINLRGIFKIERISSGLKENYINCEENIINILRKDEEYYKEYNGKIELQDSLSLICDLNNKTKQESDSREIYERISGLGNSKSKVRQLVNMDDIYMLFYHTISKDDLYLNDKKIKRLVETISYRTWNNWRERYNKRFKNYIN